MFDKIPKRLLLIIIFLDPDKATYDAKSFSSVLFIYNMSLIA